MPDTYGWVIEREESKPPDLLYLAVDGRGPHWSLYHVAALRFSRQEDAEHFMVAYLPDKNHRIVEHGWSHDALHKE